MESGSPPPEQPAPDSPQGPQAPLGPGGPEAPPSGWQQPIAGPQGWEGRALASWGSRVGSALLDGLILLIPVAALIVLVVVVAAGSDVGAVVTAVISFVAYVLIALFYAPVLMGRDGQRNGQTWGKQIVGIRVIRDAGQPIDIGYGFFREFLVKNLLFGLVGGWFFGIPTLLNYLWPLWDDQNRCLHDMIVKSHVVRA
jgi:uncharacterized RDD family membrane protein YckC